MSGKLENVITLGRAIELLETLGFYETAMELCGVRDFLEAASTSEGAGRGDGQLENQVRRLVEAINWACGCGEQEFTPSVGDEATGNLPRFWWRHYLTEKASLVWSREEQRYIPAPPSGEQGGAQQ